MSCSITKDIGSSSVNKIQMLNTQLNNSKNGFFNLFGHIYFSSKYDYFAEDIEVVISPVLSIKVLYI